jgi:hypothetical protein
MSYVSDRERERFRALLRHAAIEDSRRLHPDPYERETRSGDRLEHQRRSGTDVRPAIPDNAQIKSKPGLRAYRVVCANGQVSVRGSLDAARRVVERLSAHDPPLPGILPAEIWEVHPRSDGTDDHQFLVETYAAAEESVTGSSDGEPPVPSLEPRRVATITSRRAVSKTPAAVGAGVGALAAVFVVRRVLRRFA